MAWVQARFEAQVKENDVLIWAELLLAVGGEAAIVVVEDRIFKGKQKYSRDLREVVRDFIQDTREHGAP